MRTARHYLFVVALLFAATGAWAKPPAIIAVADLPVEARHTLQLIKVGAPLPFRQDGAVFGNFERRLPMQWRGYYREYTVVTPGLTHRGPRRIVAGVGPKRDVRTSGEYYYTADHYGSFKRIRE